MKKYVLFLLASFTILNCCSLYSQTNWEYKIKPFTKEWNNLKSIEEIRTVQQIPDTILQRMTAEELVTAWIELPGRIELLAYNTFQQGFDENLKHFNVLRELLYRIDAGPVIMNKYLGMTPNSVNSKMTSKEKGKYISEFGFIELLLSQEIILNSIPNSEIKILIKKAIDNIETKMSVNNDPFWLETGAILAGRLFKYDKNKYFEQILNQENEISLSLDNGETGSKLLFDRLFMHLKKCVR